MCNRPDLIIRDVIFENSFDGFSVGQPMGKMDVIVTNIGTADAGGPAKLPGFTTRDVS